MRVYLDNVAIRLSCFESDDGSVKVRKMFFGPVNLYANAA
jgi:hypothetical protein